MHHQVESTKKMRQQIAEPEKKYGKTKYDKDDYASYKKEKRKNKKSKKKKHRKRSSSSSSNSSDEDVEMQWIEKPSSVSKTETSSVEQPLQRDEWMSLSSSLLCSSREKKPVKKQDVNILDKPGQSSRELNPYWMNGGSGLPKEEKSNARGVNSVMNVEWLKKSFQRAQEQACQEGKSLEEIAEQRWGSLATIKSMIAEAEKNSKLPQSRDHDRDYKRHKHYNIDNKRYNDRSRSHSREKMRRYDEYQQPLNDNKKLYFKRPGSDYSHFDDSYRTKDSNNTTKNWKKSQTDNKRFASDNKITESSSPNKILKTEGPVIAGLNKMSDDDLNKLGAKIIKAEIMGDTELAESLKEQLKNGQLYRKNNPSVTNGREEEIVILTTTDSRGITRPLERRNHNAEPQGRRKRDKMVNAYEDGQRIRYFADDDKYSLQEMFQREKGSSAHEENDKVLVKMASKRLDMDELFEESIARSSSDVKQDRKDKMRAIHEHKKMEKNLKHCRSCIDSGKLEKHLIVTIGTKICLSLPGHVSLTYGHCILSPINHVTSQTHLDEDVWEELKMFKKSLIKMFTEKNEYPVFFEVFMGRKHNPHMYLTCIPLPEEVGSMAPMYFKKALLECEMEWSTNKKIVDLSQKNVRQAIPKGLPYFAVEFGDQKGFAHVIEDEQLFPRNFAQEIIGGMLDLSSDKWRKPQREKFDQQKAKVLTFSELWKEYNSSTNELTNF